MTRSESRCSGSGQDLDVPIRKELRASTQWKGDSLHRTSNGWGRLKMTSSQEKVLLMGKRACYLGYRLGYDGQRSRLAALNIMVDDDTISL